MAPHAAGSQLSYPLRQVEGLQAPEAALRRRNGSHAGEARREAKALFEKLLLSEGEPLLLHGDLHQENILSAGRRTWLAIDPKGVVGEAAHDTAALLRNPVGALDAPDPKRLLERRLDVLSGELGLGRARVRGWGLARAVLAAYWGLEDCGRVWDEALAFAGLLAEIKD